MLDSARYHVAEALPLPRGTRNLFWHRDALDRGLLWFVNHLHHRSQPDQQPDLRAIPSDLLELALTMTWRGFELPDWARQNAGKAMPRSRRARALREARALFTPSWQTHYIPMPRHTFTTVPASGSAIDLMIVALPHLRRRSYCWNNPDENAGHFLALLRRAGTETWALYPRTLRARSWESRPSTMLRGPSVAALAPVWLEAALGQPTLAITPEDRAAGRPAVLGLLRDPEPGNFFDDHAIDGPSDFWRCASRAARAMLVSRGVVLPPPPQDRLSLGLTRFTWSVFVDLADPDGRNLLLPPATRVTLTWDGWDPHALCKEREIPAATPDEGRALLEVARAMQVILPAMVPASEPLLLDRFSLDHDDLEKDYSRSCFSYHGPNWGPGEHVGAASGHTLIRELARLPGAWRDAVEPYLVRASA